MRLSFLSWRPSPAFGVAFLALVVALSGTAVALPGKNTVDSGDLKRGAVKSSDIGRGAVTSTKLRNGAVTTAKIRNNAVSGAKINEGSLAQVPSAASAGNANTVGGFGPSGIVRSAFAGDNDNALVGVSGTVLTTTITAPGPGFLLINAGSDVFGSAADALDCWIEVDETQSPPSIRTIEIDGAANSEEDCTTETTVQVGAGSHKVDLEGLDVAPTTTFDEAALQVLFVPFGATGSTP
ncbi:MAG: hypothetical protein QOH58_3140 [Thermoleophilaceae bacterium]|nr:hypothetical protein [Thermoleophilaceae bacterium]